VTINQRPRRGYARERAALPRSHSARPRIIGVTEMFLQVAAAAKVTLEDAENFRSFKVVVTLPQADEAIVRDALSDIATLPDQTTAWVFERALREWPGHSDDAEWQASLTAMIAKAKPYGWVDEANRSIKAHVEWVA
jgi:hypothetical protein